MCHAGRGLGKLLQVTLLVLLTEGQVAQITGTDLTIAVKAIRDFTSEGCLGGPADCQDYVNWRSRTGENGWPLFSAR